MTFSPIAYRTKRFYFEQSPGLSEESQKSSQQIIDVENHIFFPISRQDSLERKFIILRDQWKSRTQYLSSITEMVLDPAYQQIIGLGPLAVPLILSELEHDPDYWFEALKSITGVDPVVENDMGNLSRMTESWLDWGKVNSQI